MIGIKVEEDVDSVAILSPLAVSVARTAFQASFATTEEAEIRIEKTKKILMKFDEQEKNPMDKSSKRQLQQLRTMAYIKDAGNGRIKLSPVAGTRKQFESTESKDEDADEVYCDDKENSGRGAVENAGKSTEKTKELLMKFDEQKRNWKEQSQRPLQQLRMMASSKDAGNNRIPLSPRKKLELTKSKDVPMNLEDTEEAFCDDKENASSCSESKEQLTDEHDSAALKSQAREASKGEWEDNMDHFPTILDARPKSTDSMESTGSSLSTQYVRKMKGIVETQPLGGAKYYIMVNTKKGQAKIVHEAMPAGGREGFTCAMQEKGYEIVEYDFLQDEVDGVVQEGSFGESSVYCDTKMNGIRETQPLGGAKYYIMANTKKGQAKIVHEAMPTKGREGFAFAMQEQGYEVYEYDLLSREENEPTNGENEPTNGDNEPTNGENEPSRRGEYEPIKYDSFQSRFKSDLVFDVVEQIDDAFNKVLDVAERIDDALTGNGCNVRSDHSFDHDDNHTVEERNKRRKSRPSRVISRSSSRSKKEGSRNMSRLERRRPRAYEKN